MKKFTLEIELGNDAMRTSKHLAKALRQVANRLSEKEYMESAKEGDLHRGVMDLNGNTVGFWRLEK